MCINLRQLSSGAQVSCRDCWQCKNDRAKDVVGRCIAEAKSSAFVVRATLTYGEGDRVTDSGHAHAETLHYEDVQKYMARLRKHTVGGVRYFCAGEYGSFKSRSHFHLLLFFKEQLTPEMRFHERYHHKWQGPKKPVVIWDDGFVYYENFTGNQLGQLVAGMRYVVKYLVKDQGEGSLKTSGKSVYPPLGMAFFRVLAGDYVDAGLSPGDFKYSFGADVCDTKGQPMEFWMTGVTQTHFLESFVVQWRAWYGADNWPQSDLVEEFLVDREVRERRRLGLPDYSLDEIQDQILNAGFEKDRLWPGREGAEAEKIARIVRAKFPRFDEPLKP